MDVEILKFEGRTAALARNVKRDQQLNVKTTIIELLI